MTNKPTDVFSRIDMKGGDRAQCWEWTRSVREGSRPFFWVGGKRQIAYRLVYELVHGVELDKAQMLLHQCDNPVCCNPYHLRVGEHQENMDEMKERDRHGMPRTVVRNIRRLLDQGRPHQEIADLYGCSRETITAINNDRAHKHEKEGLT